MKKPIPFPFVLEALEGIDYTIRPMFGCHAIYIEEKLVLILRNQQEHQRDNGVWIASQLDHHASLKSNFPSMRSIELLGKGPTKWQNLPADADDFEESALKACHFIRKRDPRIGTYPKPRRKKT
jgi:hypothetical protein